MLKRNSVIVHFLWTGGWDSTFRLLQLVIILKRTVQPYYIIDPDRKSTGHETRAMQEIKRQLLKKIPEVETLLLPTKYSEMGDIYQNIEITNAYARVRKRIPIGSQYEFLARFANQNKLKDLELSLEKGRGSLDQMRILFADLLDKILVKIDDSGAINYVMDEKYSGLDIFHIFQYFRFPLRELDKVEMEIISKERGFYNIMEYTWFCHRPLKNNTPCGVCTPCTLTVKEGMAHRLPLSSMIRYYLRVILSREQFKDYFPRVYRFIKNIMGLLNKTIKNI